MEWIVLKLSGSLLYPPRPDYLGELKKVLLEASSKRGIAVVVGGGSVARDYIKALRALGINQSLQDLIGIDASRLNALLLAMTLYPHASLSIPRDTWNLLEAARVSRIVALGGFQPGQSTNAVSLIAAEALGAKIVVNALSGVPGVYRSYPPAESERHIECMTLDELWKIVRNHGQEAGSYKLLDHLAYKLAERSSISLLFLDGRDLESLKSVLIHGEKRGTLVIPRGSQCPKRLF